MAFLPHAALVLAACLGVWALKKLDWLAGMEPLRDMGLLLALALPLGLVRARDMAAPLAITLRTVALLFGAYAVAAYPVMSDALLAESRWGAALFHAGPWVAGAAAVLAWRRPALALVPAVFVAWKKHEMARLFGFPLNATDYYPVAELTVFLALGAGLAAQPGGRREAAPGWGTSHSVFLAGFGLHLANYFYSAIEKTRLPGAGPLDWIVQNETLNIALATQATGLGPLSGTPWAAAAMHAGMGVAWPVTNAVTFAIQALALTALWRVRWGVLLTLAYDAMHLIIFITTSILFWKWMTLNVGLVLALRAVGRPGIPWPAALMATGVALLGPLIFKIAWLGWFDSEALNRASVSARLTDGSEVALPAAHFLEGSAELAKSRLGQPFGGHFREIGAFGKARLGLGQMHAAARCALEVGDSSRLPESFARAPRLARFFREHHAWLLEHAGEDGRWPVWFFPHHSWSTPSLYRGYGDLDLRDIDAYVYHIESVCLAPDGRGGLHETLVLRGEHVIELD